MVLKPRAKPDRPHPPTILIRPVVSIGWSIRLRLRLEYHSCPIGAILESQGRVLARGQPCLDCLVGVLRVVPGITVVVGLTAAFEMLAYFGRHWCRSGRLAALALLAVPLVVPEVVLELDLLPFVDQLLADQ